MKKSILLLIALFAIFSILTTSCKKDDDDVDPIVPEDPSEITVSSNITSNTTWETGKTYILAGRITVVSGVTLTIEPGVIVKGQAGTGPNATALLIARGGKINAVGTATEPIIFTTVADEIVPGEIASPNLEPTLNGLWGGVIILGNAPIYAAAASVQIEGIPPSDPNGLYGGTNPNDNSGTFQYVSIRHGGANIGEGNEINGLTLGGVGSGTTISHVEVVANQDDGIEIFGGTVNVSDVIILNTGDDAIDTDQGWDGTLDNWIVINPGDEACELDGTEGSAASGNFTLTNGTIQALDADGLVDNDANTNVNMNNVYFFDLTFGQDFDELPTSPIIPIISNLECTLDTGVVADYFKDGSDAFVTEVAAGANTVGADASEFNTWSWSAVAGKLTNF
jgi:hypothetical protein